MSTAVTGLHLVPPSRPKESSFFNLVQDSLAGLHDIHRAGEAVEMPPDKEGWDEYRRLVISQLESLHERQNKLSSSSNDVRIEIAKLKIKASVWGLLGGAIPAAVAMAWILLK